MAVPKTAVNEHHGMQSRENKVWLAWKLLCVQPVAEPECMQAPPEQHLWLRVLRSDPRHHPRADFRGDDISHWPLGRGPGGLLCAPVSISVYPFRAP
jgi:hypothetical protein